MELKWGRGEWLPPLAAGDAPAGDAAPAGAGGRELLAVVPSLLRQVQPGPWWLRDSAGGGAGRVLVR
jgi:hypothetical protein